MCGFLICPVNFCVGNILSIWKLGVWKTMSLEKELHVDQQLQAKYLFNKINKIKIKVQNQQITCWSCISILNLLREKTPVIIAKFSYNQSNPATSIHFFIPFLPLSSFSLEHTVWSQLNRSSFVIYSNLITFLISYINCAFVFTLYIMM